MGGPRAVLPTCPRLRHQEPLKIEPKPGNLNLPGTCPLTREGLRLGGIKKTKKTTTTTLGGLPAPKRPAEGRRPCGERRRPAGQAGSTAPGLPCPARGMLPPGPEAFSRVFVAVKAPRRTPVFSNTGSECAAGHPPAISPAKTPRSAAPGGRVGGKTRRGFTRRGPPRPARSPPGA